VLALVQEDRLEAKNEEAVFQWVVRWWEAGTRPEAELLAVMKHVRFAIMDASFVQVIVRAWPALDSKEGRDVIVLSLLDAKLALRRWGFGAHLVYVLGGSFGNEAGEELSTVDVYDPRTNAWKQVASMPITRYQHAGVALDGKIYALGGYGVDILSSMDMYDPQSDSWHLLADMAYGRAVFAAAAAGGKIYVTGGADDNYGSMEMVEAFDPLLGAWAAVASMSVGRRCHSVAVVDGKIYAIGGLNSDGETLDSAEAYDPQTDSWQQMASLPEGGQSHAATAMGGKIYVSGGYNENGTLRTVVVFDPQVNTWTEVASMGTGRCNHASAAIGGKLYLFGGRSAWTEDGERTASVEAYDPASNTWAQVSDLTSARDELASVAL